MPISQILPPFRVIAETKGGTNPYFATGEGYYTAYSDGFWRVGNYSSGYYAGEIRPAQVVERPDYQSGVA